MSVNTLSLSLPKEIVAAVAGKRLALVGFEPPDAAKLAEALDAVQAFTRTFSQDKVSPGHDLLSPFDIVVVNVQQGGKAGGWVDMDKLEKNDKPLLFAGSSESLFHYAPTAHHNPYDFLTLPWHPEELVLRVYHIVSEVARESARRAVPADDKARVLVADDDLTTTTLLSVVLRKYGMECDVAHDGGMAVELARRSPPQAAILDINMPYLDGFEVLATLKNDPRMSHIHVIMLTARQQETDIIRGFGLGADDYVVKPFSPIELVTRLKRLLSRVR